MPDTKSKAKNQLRFHVRERCGKGGKNFVQARPIGMGGSLWGNIVANFPEEHRTKRSKRGKDYLQGNDCRGENRG